MFKSFFASHGQVKRFSGKFDPVAEFSPDSVSTNGSWEPLTESSSSKEADRDSADRLEFNDSRSDCDNSMSLSHVSKSDSTKSKAAYGLRKSHTYNDALQASAKKRESLKMSTGEFSSTGRPLRCVSQIVKSWRFNVIVTVLIFVNALSIAGQVEYAAANPNRDEPEVFFVLEAFFTTAFLAELILRLSGIGVKAFLCSSDRLWNWLDIIVVSSSLLELCISLAQKTDSTLVALKNLRTIRVLRVTRVMRVLRFVKFGRTLRPLHLLIVSILSTLRTLGWAMFLLGLIMFAFSIMFTDVVTEHLYVSHLPWEASTVEAEMQKYFGSLPLSMMTLFQAISGGVSWREPVDTLVSIHWAWGYGFATYIAFCYFAVLNVMTGVFCQSAIENAEKDHHQILHAVQAEREHYEALLSKIFAEIDDDGSGTITIKEFENHFQSKPVQALFSALDLDASDAWALFHVLDQDGSFCLTISEFIDGCMIVRGTASALDMEGIRRETWGLRNDLKQMQEQQAGFFQKLEKSWQHLVRMCHQAREDDRNITQPRAMSCSIPHMPSPAQPQEDSEQRAVV
eukprot:TRINITY_DN18338_c0_g2_i1.p1 TRINITY_DN18338_c0_g2~~TRINITY_DN18338_c0_g2_i1.p1  ORF type:complete len:633 (+),score=77.52 TRINITY_DN18338_c0_g2_i1:198-1901(+)